MNDDSLHTLSGAYALHALSPDEAASFERHLASCPACRQEVLELQHAAARMGASEADQPPAELRGRVLAAVDRETQQRPRVPQQVAVVPQQVAAAPRRRMPRLLAAAAAVVLLVAGGFVVGQVLDEDQDTRLAASVTRVFEAPDARTTTLRTGNGREVAVATSPSLGEMALDTDELPELDDDRVYQLWAIADGTPESAGLLEEPDSGAAMEMPGEGVAVAITVEPAGGSMQPTTEPIMTVVPADV